MKAGSCFWSWTFCCTIETALLFTTRGTLSSFLLSSRETPGSDCLYWLARQERVRDPQHCHLQWAGNPNWAVIKCLRLFEAAPGERPPRSGAAGGGELSITPAWWGLSKRALKAEIKWERKCAGAGLHLQKYFCKVGGMDVLGPVNKCCHQQWVQAWAWFFSLCCGLQLQREEKWQYCQSPIYQ